MIEGAVLAYLMGRADQWPDDLHGHRQVSEIRPQMREKNMKIGSYAKAIVSAVSAGAAALVTAMGDGIVTPGEGVTVGLAVLAALGITAAVPNAAQSDPPTRTPGYRGGHGDPL